MNKLILVLLLIAGFSVFSQQYQIDDWGSFDLENQEQFKDNKYFLAVDRAINNRELLAGDRSLLVKLVYSYIEEPTLEKEKVLKALLKFEQRLEASPLVGVKDGVIDHVQRLTGSLGVLGDFASPVLEIMSSLESEVTDVMKEGLSALSADSVNPKDMANIREIAFKIFVYQMDDNAKASVGTAITARGANKQHLLDYMLTLDLLRMAEETGVSELYELVTMKALLEFPDVSRQIQGLKYYLLGNAVLVDWSFPISERHRNLKNTGLYFKQVKQMIKKSGRKNVFKSEWSNSLKWMRRTLRKRSLGSHIRPLTTILSAGIMLSDIKLSLLYAKINTYIISSRVLIENSNRTNRLLNKYVIIPALQTAMRVPAWMLGGALKVVHGLVSEGDKAISRASKKLKPHFDYCKYIYKDWVSEFRKNIY